jgi:hypothetical protein
VVRGDEVVGLRTATSRTFATDLDGVMETVAWPSPVHFQEPGGDGVWRAIDTDLVGEAGVLKPAASGLDVELAGEADAGVLASVSPGGGVSVGFGFDGAEGVAAVADGDTALYEGVAEGVDLELQVRAGGLKESVVLAGPGAPSAFVFPLVLEGVTAVLGGDGGVDYVDGAGAVAAVTPPGFMVDSAGGEGGPARSEGVSYALSGPAGSQVLTVSVDAGWLADPARVFPVVVDPTFEFPFESVAAGADDTYVVEGSTADRSTATSLEVGVSGGDVRRSFLHFPALDHPDFEGASVFDARLALTQTEGGSCTDPGLFEAHRVDGAWEGDEVTSYPGPVAAVPPSGGLLAESEGGPGYGTGCTETTGETAVHITAAAWAWADGTWGNDGIMLRAADEEAASGFRRFASADAASPADQPRLELVWGNPAFGPADSPDTPTEVAPDGLVRLESPLPEPPDVPLDLTGVYSDPEDEEGHLQYFVYASHNFLWGTLWGDVVDSGAISPLPVDLPYEVDLTMRATATEGQPNTEPPDPEDLPATSALSAPVELRVPVVHLTGPADGQTVFGDVTVTAEVAAPTGLDHVEFLLDDVPVAGDDTAPYTFTGSSTGATDGPHTLTARAVYTNDNTYNSPTNTITVDNTLGLYARLDLDWQNGHLTGDEYAALGVDAVMGRAGLPERYAEAEREDDNPLARLFGFIRSQVIPGTELADAIIDSSDVSPAPEDGTGPASGEELPGDPGSTIAGCEEENQRTLEKPVEETYCTETTTTSGGQDIMVLFRPESVDPVHGVDETDVHNSSEDVPDYVDSLLDGARAAAETYAELGYDLPETITDGSGQPIYLIVRDLNAEDLVPVLQEPPGLAVPYGDYPVFVTPASEAPAQLAAHESFHVHQYDHIDIIDVLGELCPFDLCSDTTLWWMEASAEWATHKAIDGSGAENRIRDEDPAYDDAIDTFLAGPDQQLTRFDAAGSRQYGAFVFAEYLERELGADTILAAFEELGSTASTAIEAIRSTVEDEDVSFDGLLDRFWRATYLLEDDLEGVLGTDPLGFAQWGPGAGETSPRVDWLTELAASEPTGGDLFSSRPRPARSAVELGPEDQSWVGDLVEVRPGGMIATDLTWTGAAAGAIRVNVTAATDREAVRLAYIRYSEDGLTSPCSGFSTRVVTADGAEDGILVPVAPGCSTATVFVVNRAAGLGSSLGQIPQDVSVFGEFVDEADLPVALASPDGEGADFSLGGQPEGVSQDGSRALVASSFGQLYIWHRATGSLELVTAAMGGGPSDGFTTSGQLSPDGRWVAFISGDGDLVADDENEAPDVFVRDVDENTTTRISLTPGGSEIEGGVDGYVSDVSGGGDYVVYTSNSADLVDDAAHNGPDTNDNDDVFVWDRQEDETVRVSVGTGGSEADGSADFGTVSADGSRVAFASNASDLDAVESGSPSSFDVFVHDVSTGVTTRVSADPGGGAADGDSMDRRSTVLAT